MFMSPLKPISLLRNKHIEILSVLLVKRYEILKSIKDPSLLPKLLFSIDVRDAIKESTNISTPNYYNAMAMFKKLGIIVDGDLDKRIIPELVDGKHSLLIAFRVDGSE